MDRLSLELGKLALGNVADAPGLEITMIGPVLDALADADILISGADLSPSLNGSPVPVDTVLHVEAGDRLAFGKPVRGCRAYVLVAGGVSGPLQMGSVSPISSVLPNQTVTGDLYGPAGARAEINSRGLRALALWRGYWSSDGPVHFVWGPQSERFAENAKLTFLRSPYRVTPNSNRVGLTLEGPRLEALESLECLSDPSPLGAIQVPPEGVPLILLIDRGSVGGYAKIGTVVSYDCWRLGQVAPGASVTFESVDPEAGLPEQGALREAIRTRIELGKAAGYGN
jgi:antagonist of KipI